MIKLFKLLKPYKWELILILILVTVSAISNLILPDKMSTIIGDGITTEMQYEQTQNGDDIYIDIGQFTGADEDMLLPKFQYKNAGILVTEIRDERHYAIINMNGLIPVFETNNNGDVVYLRNPLDGTQIPIPQFARTSDGLITGESKQGELLIDSAGSPQIEKKQVSNFNIIISNGVQMLAYSILASICAVMVAYLSSKVGNNFGRDIRGKLFTKIIEFSSTQEDKFGSATLITRNTNDVTQIQNFVIQGLRIILMVPVMFFGGLILSLSKDKEMTMVLLVSIPVVVIFIAVIAKVLMPLFNTLQKKIDRLTLVSRENITGVRVIRAFGGEKKEKEKFKNANKDLTDIAIKQARIMALLMPAMTIIMSFTSIAIILISAINVDKILQTGSTDFSRIGNMMAVMQYVIQIMMSIVMFALIFILYPRAVVSANRINEVFDCEEKDIINKKDTIKDDFSKSGEIEFKNVSYYFEGAKEAALNDISFAINKGDFIAIIGSTGSGKSTLVNLIPRLYEATLGEVLVDGVNVKDIDISALRKKIGFATQNATLMQGTIRDNILYGASDLSENNLVNSARIAQAEEFILEKEGGYDHKVEQKAANFSGGQKQRLSIARALSRNSEILIFDDSFSALDFKTDAALRKALKDEIKDTTIIIVAQRIGTVMNADKILVLDEGRLVGIGEHKQLLKTCDTYQKMALSQMSEEELGLEGGRA